MTMRLDGTARRKVLGGNWEYFQPEYSPDGTEIAFEGTRGGLQSAIWVIGVDGEALQRLTGPRLRAFGASWSPDGRHIVFTDRCCIRGSNIWVMRTDGTRKRRLTDFPDGHQGAFASYSPNGRKIVLSTDLAHDDGCCNDIFVMRADGSGLRRLTTSQPGAFGSDWGPRP
jgi:TolB protein